MAIKAAFGGGGRGMKVVHSPGDVEEAMASAQREAKAFFGRDEVYVERYLTWPRHVEVQVVGDQHGEPRLGVDAGLLGAAPSPEAHRGGAGARIFPTASRRRWVRRRSRPASAVGYYNAGTVEFIYQDGEFFFLEMNTRLQVEHPVTEAITGINLVEWQIRVASGEPLPMTQDEVLAQRRGHAIEVRINAEDPAGGAFLPSPGRITRLDEPHGFGVRFDSGYNAGDEVSQYYDNLIAKLVVWGKDRPTAIARTISALEETKVEGVATTIPADLAILRHPDFVNVEHSTKWVEERLDLSALAPATAPAPGGSDDGRRAANNWSNAARRSRSTASVSTSRCGCPTWRQPPVRPAAAGVASSATRDARPDRARPALVAAATSRCRCRARSSRCSSRSVSRSRPARRSSSSRR